MKMEKNYVICLFLMGFKYSAFCFVLFWWFYPAITECMSCWSLCWHTVCCPLWILAVLCVLCTLLEASTLRENNVIMLRETPLPVQVFMIYFCQNCQLTDRGNVKDYLWGKKVLYPSSDFFNIPLMFPLWRVLSWLLWDKN